VATSVPLHLCADRLRLGAYHCKRFSRLYSNWLNYFVYQTTPYDVTNIEPLEK